MKNKRHLKSLFLTAVIFLIGLLLISFVNQYKFSLIETKIKTSGDLITTAMFELSLLDLIESNLSCTHMLETSKKALNELEILSSMLNSYEFQKTQKYIYKEEEYITDLIKNWILHEKLKKTCNLNYTTVLFFYNKTCDECSWQGFYLGYFKEKNKDNLMIFAVPTDRNTKIVEFLFLEYNISSVPSVIINRDKSIEGYLDKEEQRTLLCSYNNFTFC